MRYQIMSGMAVGLMLGASLFLTGCGSNPDEGGRVIKSPLPRHDQEKHDHAKNVCDLGNNHGKVIVEQGGVLKLLILGADEIKIARIPSQEIKAQVRAVEGAEFAPIVLKPTPQEGDPSGQTSQFAGDLPERLRNQPLVVILRLTIDGEAYQPELETVSGGHAAGHGMPKGVARGGAEISPEEKTLYLEPGGVYTVADIAANGNTVPSVKFKGMQWAHEDDLKPGDKICPITNNKADAKCTWIVNGKEYNFCCPPCLDKFVGWAKKQPGKIKDPSEYVEK